MNPLKQLAADDQHYFVVQATPQSGEPVYYLTLAANETVAEKATQIFLGPMIHQIKAIQVNEAQFGGDPKKVWESIHENNENI